MKSIEAQHLDMDQHDGCTISGYRNEAPRIVYPRPGGAIPHTGGQVSESAVREWAVSQIARAFMGRH